MDSQLAGIPPDHLLRMLTDMSWEKGLIPKVCPVCRNPTGYLVIHHWGYLRKVHEITIGNYRRMCYSCNSQLGQIYAGDYPFSWEEQLAALSSRIQEYLSFDTKNRWPSSYPNFTGLEMPHSLITQGELDYYEKILPGIGEVLVTRPKRRKKDRIVRKLEVVMERELANA